jgi:hypothetical protein
MPPATRRPTKRAKPTARDSSRLRAVRDHPSITVRLEDLQDFNESVNWFLYGNSGVGKTAFSAFAPRGYFLSTEKGVIAAKRVGSTAKLLRAPTWEHVEASLDWADENLTLDDWLIVDSVSKMQILMIRWILGTLHEENDARDPDVPQIQDHQKWQNMFMRFFDRIMNAKYNSIVIATAMHKEDPEGESLVLPAITGKDYTISNYCCAQADIVSYLGIARQKDRNAPTIRRLLNETVPPWFAKDRYNILPRWVDIEEGDFTVIEELIERIMEDSTPNERRAAKAAGR